MPVLDPATIHHIRFYQTLVPNKRGKLKPGVILTAPFGLTEFINRVKALPGVEHLYSWATNLRYISVATPEKLPWLIQQLESLRKEYEQRLPDVALSTMECPPSATFTPESFGVQDKNFTGKIKSDDGKFEFYFNDGYWCGYEKLTAESVEFPVHPTAMGCPGGLRLNYSSSKAFRTCPWQYFAKSVARIPVYPNMATHIGWSVHNAAEYAHRELLGQGPANTIVIPPINLDKMLEIFFRDFDKLQGSDLMPPATDAEMQLARYKGENMVRNYFNFLLHDEQPDLIKYTLVEKTMRFNLEKSLLGVEGAEGKEPVVFQGAPVQIAGTADLVYQVEPPEGYQLPPDTIGLTLADLKTSVRGLDRLGHVDLLQHLGQLSLYSMMLEKSFEREYNQKAKVLYVEIRNITPFDGVRSLRVGFTGHDAAETSDLKRAALHLNKEIVEAFKSGNFDRTPGYHCTDCPASVPCFLSSGLGLNSFQVTHTEPVNIREDREIATMNRPGGRY